MTTPFTPNKYEAPDLSGLSLSLTGFKAFFTGINKGLNRLSNSAEEIRFCCNFAVPSNVFNTTFPVNPSVTNTSAFFVEKSLPSIFPTKFKLLFFNNLYAAFSTSRPLVSSSPLFRRPTLGLSISIITSANFAPIIPY